MSCLKSETKDDDEEEDDDDDDDDHDHDDYNNDYDDDANNNTTVTTMMMMTAIMMTMRITTKSLTIPILEHDVVAVFPEVSHDVWVVPHQPQGQLLGRHHSAFFLSAKSSHTFQQFC
jgi:hypothetical protein